MKVLHEVIDLTHCSSVVRSVVDKMSSILEDHVGGRRTALHSCYETRDDVNNSGWAVSTLEASLRAFQAAETFEESLVAAVNLGGYADGIGAVNGQIAGALKLFFHGPFVRMSLFFPTF